MGDILYDPLLAENVPLSVGSPTKVSPYILQEDQGLCLTRRITAPNRSRGLSPLGLLPVGKTALPCVRMIIGFALNANKA